MRTLVFALVLAWTCLASPARAGESGPPVDGATLDPDHTSATFWIRHVLAPVAGRFGTTAGVIDIPASAPAKGRVHFSVSTASLDTGVAARDNHVRSADFLDAAAYPKITFASEKITPAGKGVYRVTGRLAIKDVTRTVTIPVKYLGTRPHPMMPCVDVSGYEAHLVLSRLAYHVGDGKFFKAGALGDMVEIRLAGEVLAPRPECAKPAAP